MLIFAIFRYRGKIAVGWRQIWFTPLISCQCCSARTCASANDQMSA